MTRPAEPAPSPPGAASLVLTPAKADYLLETIVCSAYESAMQAAALALVLGACASAGEALRISAFRHILIDDSEVMLFALSYRDDIGLGGQAVEALQLLYRAMAEAKRDLAPLMRSKGGGTRDRGAVQRAAHAWRQIAEAAARAIEQLQDIVRARLHATYQRDGRRVIGFLRQAVNGDGKVFDGQGALVLPVLEQRRRMPRFPVQQDCRLVTSSGAHRAQLADVSKQGMAVVCAAAPVVGEAVTVELEDGRPLGATVVRTQGDKIGLRLARSLATNDPLFAAGRD